MKRCKGCGAILQSENPKLPGYTPKESSDYCQRCFRLTHYDDLMFSMRTGIDEDGVLKSINEVDSALVLWVVDLFDFEANMISGLSRKLIGKDIVLVGTKRDLLPQTVTDEKLVRFIYTRLKEYGIQVKELLMTGLKDRDLKDDIAGVVKTYGKGKPVIVMGRANAGKSTLLNRLMDQDVLTSSRYPGTTLDLNEVTIGDQVYVDTPGIEIHDSMLMIVDEKDLKDIMPTKPLKPEVYQVTSDQSFAIGGLARIDVHMNGKGSCVFYRNDRLNIHRCRLDKADDLWLKHKGDLLKPIANEAEFRTTTEKKNDTKVDVVIAGVGWVCISGDVDHISVQAPKDVNVVFRKAMI